MHAIIHLAVLICAVLSNMYRYGIFCGVIMTLLRMVPLHSYQAFNASDSETEGTHAHHEGSHPTPSGCPQAAKRKSPDSKNWPSMRGGVWPAHFAPDADGSSVLQPSGGDIWELDMLNEMSDAKLYSEGWTKRRSQLLTPIKLSMQSGMLTNGEYWTAALTCGDGACALHSWRGDVRSHPHGRCFFWENGSLQRPCLLPP